MPNPRNGIIDLKYVNPDGTFKGMLPDAANINISPIFCDSGVLSFDYPSTGINFAWLQAVDEFEVAVMIDGLDAPRLRAIVQELSGNDADFNDANMWSYSGNLIIQRMAEAVVYPPNWPSVTPPEFTFTNANAGTIISALIQKAQARGALSGIQTSFNGNIDSSGAAWTKMISVAFVPGVDYLSILKNLYELGLCEFEMTNRILRLYNPGTLGVDRTIGLEPLTFRLGRDVGDSPRKLSTRNLATAMLSAGDEGMGLYAEKVDTTAVATRRRIESFGSQGGIQDSGTLLAYTEAELARRVKPVMEKTHGLEFGAGSPRPFTHFDTGDWAYNDVGKGLERLRIKQWVMGVGDDGRPRGTVVLNDLIAEREELLARRVERLIGGTTITGASQVVDVPPELIDGIAPKAPAGLSITSTAYTDNGGHTLAQFTASWLQVVENSDNTVCTDLGYYVLEWHYISESIWRPAGTSTGLSLSWSPLLPGQDFQTRIRAVDKHGNSSGWALSNVITSGNDVTPPPVPSSPVVGNYLGLLRTEWDGLGVANVVMPVDFAQVRVHISTISGFTPSAATLQGSLAAKGSHFFSGVYGTIYYVKLIAVDFVGNLSAPSAQASGSPAQLVGTDIGGNVIDASNITFKDIGNLVPDGSFEIPELNAKRIAAATGTWVNSTGIHGLYNMKVFSAATPTTKSLFLVNDVPVKSGEIYWVTMSYAGASGSNGNISVRAFFTYQDGTTGVIRIGILGSVADGFWKPRQVAYYTIPANAVKMNIRVDAIGVTTGDWSVDEIEVRAVAGTALIQDAAITNAKIANLAVNSAQISDLSAGKIIAGTMTADVVIGGRFATALTGDRVELNSLGLKKFIGGALAVDIGTSAGALITGEIRSATSGRRIVLNPGGNTPGEIRMYTGAGVKYGLISTFLAPTEILEIKASSVDPGGSIQFYTPTADTDNGLYLNTSRGTMVFSSAKDFFWDGQLFTFNSSGRHEWYVGPSAQWGYVNMTKGTSANIVSPRLTFANGNGFGIIARYAYPGPGNAPRFEIRNIIDDGFENLWASSFTVNSDGRNKESVSDLDAKTALDEVLGSRVRQYRRKKPHLPGRQPLERGLVAQEAPVAIVVADGSDAEQMIDLYPMVSTLWAAVQELSRQIEGMGAR